MSGGGQTTWQIELIDVHHGYPVKGGGWRQILNDLDLRVRPGEFISLVGPSGCGKSTLLRLLLGMETPNSGRVLVEGREVIAPARDRGIVFQNYSLFPHLTVLQNVTFGLELEAFNLVSRWIPTAATRARRRQFREEAMAALERVRLGEHAHKYPGELSGGMRQRVAIAQAMIMKPKVLLMDEPFGALDFTTRYELQTFLLETYYETRMGVIFITHDLEEAIFLANRVVVLSPFYETDRGPGEGSKFVLDVPVDFAHPRTIEIKGRPAFAELLQEICDLGLNPKRRQHLRDFKLRHPDSYRTISPEEGGEEAAGDESAMAAPPEDERRNGGAELPSSSR